MHLKFKKSIHSGWGLAAFFSIVLSGAAVSYAGPVTVFSGSGFVTPENIVSLTSAFGSAPAGSYLVVDPHAGAGNSAELLVLPGNGGPATTFSSLPGNVIDGTFVPAGYGSLSGQFLVTGNGNAGVVSSAGVLTSLSLSNYTFANAVAPASFGSLGGQILLSNVEANGTYDILAYHPNGTTSVFAKPSTALSAALGFAPPGFGSIGGDLLASDTDTGNLYAINAAGVSTLFATLPVAASSSGLPQFAFAPEGFGLYGGDLFVSVSGSTFGGGDLGSVDVLNSSGSLVGEILQGTVNQPFDPRGLDFVSNTQQLIADTDPGILLTPPSAVTPVPEPSSMLLLTCLIAGFPAVRARTASSRS